MKVEDIIIPVPILSPDYSIPFSHDMFTENFVICISACGISMSGHSENQDNEMS